MQKIKIALQLIICVVIAFVLIRLNNSFCFLSIPPQKELRNISYNLFTVNATMSGFAFTVLGMLYSFSSKDYVKALEGTNVIVNKARTIIQTIIFAGASGFINLFLIVFKYNEWFQYLFILSIVFLFFCFAYFIRSMYCIYNLIKNIHEFDKKGANTKQKKESDLNTDVDTW